MTADPGFGPETALTQEYHKLLIEVVKRIVSPRMPADRTEMVCLSNTELRTFPVNIRRLVDTQPAVWKRHHQWLYGLNITRKPNRHIFEL